MIRLIAWTAVATMVSAFVYNYWLYSKYGEAYSAVSLGDAEMDVIKTAGKPSWVTDGTRWVEPQHAKDASQIVPGCVKELWYAMPWPQPMRFSFCFDASGALIDKYYWVSW